jgi:hypothetical protein
MAMIPKAKARRQEARFELLAILPWALAFIMGYAAARCRRIPFFEPARLALARI